MKKLSLLLIAGTMAMSAGAQGLLPSNTSITRVNQPHQPVGVSAAKHNTHRTTAAGDRWYNYVGYMDTLITLGGPINSTASSAPYLWNDTASQDAYTTGTFHNTMVSYAYIFDPAFSGFNDYFPTPHITAADAYTVDSIGLYGIYGINPAKTGVVDTLRVGYTWGSTSTSGDDIALYYFTNPTVLSQYGLASTDSLFFPDCIYDSARNSGGGTNYHEDIITISTNPSSNTNMNWYDTLSSGVHYHAFKLSTPANVPAGNVLAVTVSFKTGDPSFTFGSVVFTSTGTYDFNMFRPLIAFYSDLSGNPVFGPYSKTDNNTGLYKTLPNYENGWGDVYVPQWAWTAGGGASSLQYPFMDIHTKGSSLGTANVKSTITDVQAVPNPASNSTAVSFKLDAVSNVTITLTDVTGHVVASETMSNVSHGKVGISTANIPSGVYMYTVTSNGKRATGQVTIAH